MSFVTYVLGVDPILSDMKAGRYASARNRLCDKLKEWVGARDYGKILPFIIILNGIPFKDKQEEN